MGQGKELGNARQGRAKQCKPKGCQVSIFLKVKRQEALSIGQVTRGRIRHEVVKSLTSSSQKLEAESKAKVA